MIAFLDQVEQRQPVALVALGDRDDEAQVGVDHPLLRLGVAALDELGQLDLLLLGQQRPAAGLVEEELERVRRRHGETAVHVGALLLLAATVVADVDPPLVEPLVQPAELLVVELLGGDQLVELREVDAAFLFASGDECLERARAFSHSVGVPGLPRVANEA